MTEAAPAADTQPASTSSTPATGKAGTQIATGGSAPPDISWLGEGAKPEVSQYVQGKGFKSAAALAEAYQNAEKALSSRAFEVPKPEDAAGWAKIKAAMGVPESSDKYDLGEVGKALKPEALKEWGGVFHQLGLTNEQAGKLVGQVTAMSQAQQAKAHEAYVQQTEQAAERMKQEYGDRWPAFHDLATRGFNVLKTQLKLDDTKIDALERALGTKELLSLAHMVGEAKVEAGFVASDGQHRAMTRDQARAAIDGFKADREKSAALLDRNNPGHAAALSEWTQLRRIAEG